MSQARAEGSSDDVGSVAEEAAKLMGSLADWTRKHTAGEGPVGCGCDGAHGGTGSHGGLRDDAQTDAVATCAWCPVCRAHTWLRQLNPEAKAHLGAAGASLAAAMVNLLAPPTAPSRHDVEHVPLDDSPWSEDEVR